MSTRFPFSSEIKKTTKKIHTFCAERFGVELTLFDCSLLLRNHKWNLNRLFAVLRRLMLTALWPRGVAALTQARVRCVGYGRVVSGVHATSQELIKVSSK